MQYFVKSRTEELYTFLIFPCVWIYVGTFSLKQTPYRLSVRQFMVNNAGDHLDFHDCSRKYSLRLAHIPTLVQTFILSFGKRPRHLHCNCQSSARMKLFLFINSRTKASFLPIFSGTVAESRLKSTG